MNNGSKLIQWTGYHDRHKWMLDTQYGSCEFLTWARNEVIRFRKHGREAEIRYDKYGQVSIWIDSAV